MAKYIKTTENYVIPTEGLTKEADPRFPYGYMNKYWAPFIAVKEADDPIDLVDIGVGIGADGEHHLIPKSNLMHLALGKGKKAYGAVWTKTGMDFVLEVVGKGRIRLLREHV